MSDAVVLLVVEDEPLILFAIQDALETNGYAVIPAICGVDAMTALDSRHHEIAGMITDVGLGSGPDGWEVSRYARTLKPEIPVVYVTGDSVADWPAYGVPQSIMVPKPYEALHILTAVSTVLVPMTDRA